MFNNECVCQCMMVQENKMAKAKAYLQEKENKDFKHRCKKEQKWTHYTTHQLTVGMDVHKTLKWLTPGVVTSIIKFTYCISLMQVSICHKGKIGFSMSLSLSNLQNSASLKW